MAKGNSNATSQKKEMFAVFGEFDSAEEINKTAAGLKEEGDLENLVTLATENGLDMEDVETYASDQTETLTDVLGAAIGKLMVEKEHENNILVDDIVNYLMSNCDEKQLAKGVRKKGKRTMEAAKLVLKEVKKNMIEIPGQGKMGYCGPMKGYQIIREYYTK